MIRIILFGLLFFHQYSYACIGFSHGERPYAVADPDEFIMKDYANQLFNEQNYSSREQYLNKIFGVNNWLSSDNAFSLKKHSLIENIKNVHFPIKFESTRDMIGDVIVIMELTKDDKRAYSEILNFRKTSDLIELETSIRIPDSVNVFVVFRSENKDKIIVSPRAHLKNTGHCYYFTVRSQDEANKINQDICRKNKSKDACVEYNKFNKIKDGS